MADKKISALTALAQGDVVVSTDVLPIVDTSATETKKIAVNALVGAAAAAGLTNVDINSGTIDGTTIATSDITVGSGKTLNVSAGTLTLADNQISGDKVEGGTINAITINTLTSTAVNATTVDATNVEVTNIKAKDGTAAATIADSTGIVSLSANPILSGGTANGVLYLNASKVATSGSALTFDGSNQFNFTTSYQYPNISVFSTSANPIFGFRLDGSTGSGNGRDWRLEQGRVATGTFGIADLTSNATRYSIASDGTAIWNVGSGTGLEAMRLDTSGNLGIGTSSPSGRLHVATASGNCYVYSARASKSTGQVAFQLSGGTSGTDWIIYQPTNSDNLTFFGNSADRMVLDTSGNLGLGVTPSAWGLGKAFEIGNAGNCVWGVQASDIRIGANMRYDGTNYKYINSNFAARYDVNSGGTGGHSWHTAPSGTAGNTITFTQAMTLTAEGNLGLGNTDPFNNASYNALTLGGSKRGALEFRNASNANIAYLYVGSDNNLNIETSSTYVLKFNTASTERARITSGGALVVNDTDPGTARLKVVQAGDNMTAWLTNASLGSTHPVLFVENYQAASSTKYLITGDNNGGTSIRIATNGDITNTNGTYGQISDAKNKTDIVDAGSQWNDIKAVRFRKFKMKDDPAGLVQLGVVAQELEQTSPGLVDEHPDMETVEVTDEEGNVTKERQPTGTTTKSVKTSVLLMKAAVALQEAMARIEQLEAKVAALETK